MSYDIPKPPKLPARRLTHKDAKLAAKLYGLTYEEVRAREHEHNEAQRDDAPAAEPATPEPPPGMIYGSCHIKL